MDDECDFLDLPRELRFMIYRFVFLRQPTKITHVNADIPKWLRPKTHLAGRSSDGFPPWVSPMTDDYRFQNLVSSQLLRTCKTCLVEGLEVLYGENNLSFCGVKSFCCFADRWGDEIKAHMRTVTIQHSTIKAFQGQAKMVPHLSLMKNIRIIDFGRNGLRMSIDENMTLRLDPLLGLERRIVKYSPSISVLRQLFRNRQTIECVTTVAFAKTTIDAYDDQTFADDEHGKIRYKFSPSGTVKGKQTFALTVDKSWPRERYQRAVGRTLSDS